MKQRYIYAVMFSVPAFLFAAILTAALVAVVAGVLWIFVFGDNVWPSFVNRSMSVLIFAVFGVVWVALLCVAYVSGKRQEAAMALNKNHVFFAVGSSVGLVLLVVLHQLNVGNIGPKSDTIVCSDFCTTKNFSASMLPQDGSCRCLDSDGRESLISSLKALRSESK